MKFDPNKRINRWKVLLNEFDFELKHVSGKDNKIADFISRSVCLIGAEKNKLNIKNHKKEKEIISLILQLLKRKFNILNPQLEYNDEGKIILIKKEHIQAIIQYVHFNIGHPGINATYYTIKRYFNIKNLYSQIVNIISECKKCKQSKGVYFYHRPPTIRIKSSRKLERVSSDILGTFRTDDFKTSLLCKKFYLLTMTDIYSRFTEVYILRSLKTKEIIKSLQKWLDTYGKFEIFISDNGRSYCGKILGKFLKNNKIKHLFIPSYTPSSNGISERLNRTIIQILRLYKNIQLQKILEIIKRRLNIIYHRGVKGFPISILEEPNALNQVNNNITELKKKPFKIGDQVLLKNFGASKTEKQFRGNYKINKVGKKGQWVRLKGVKGWVHTKHLKMLREGECSKM